MVCEGIEWIEPRIESIDLTVRENTDFWVTKVQDRIPLIRTYLPPFEEMIFGEVKTTSERTQRIVQNYLAERYLGFRPYQTN